MVEQLRQYTNEPVSCIVDYDMHKFISKNLSKSKCNLYNLDYYKSLLDVQTGQLKRPTKTSDKKNIQKLKSTSVVINDFFININLFHRLFSDEATLCCVYHGDLQNENNDSYKVSRFKRLVCKQAERHEIFFHINFEPSSQQPELKCTYIPIPVISRHITMSPNDVHELLGLSDKEKFILVHAGAAVTGNVYKELYGFYSAINRLKTDYRIVVAGSLSNQQFPFHDGIIKAPVFNNGIDLVNACEMVISKPGMGILQDCIVTKKPLFFLPADVAERELKIKLLDRILSGNLPVIEEITTSNIKSCIEECLALKPLYEKGYEKIPVNGAEILAKSIYVLKGTQKHHIQEAIAQIKNLSPFS